MLFIWKVVFSNQFWTLSVLAIIAASLFRITAREVKGLPKALRWCIHLIFHVSYEQRSRPVPSTHFMHSSIMLLWYVAEAPHITNRSWLKLDRITKMPLPSSPMVFSTGTLTFSKVMKAVPAVGEYEVLMGLVSTPSDTCLSTSITVKPFYTNESALMFRLPAGGDLRQFYNPQWSWNSLVSSISASWEKRRKLTSPQTWRKAGSEHELLQETSSLTFRSWSISLFH